MINDNYLNGMATLAAGQAFTVPSHLAFGSTTGTITATDTQTSGEFDRNALDTPSATDNVTKYVGSRSSTEAGNEYINVVGLHNTSTLYATGDLQANFLIPSLLHTTSFDVEIEFWVTFDRG